MGNSGGTADAGASDGGTAGERDGAGAGGAAGSGADDQCPTGFGDCDSNPDDCETPLDQLTNCGACGVACTGTNGTVACQNLACVSTSCMTGFADCNDSGIDGCEASLKAVANCGSCGNDCGTGTCNAGGYCNATPLGTSVYNYRMQMQGNWIYRLSVPANDYGIQPSYSLIRTPVDGSAQVIVDAQSKPIGGLVTDATNVYWGIGGTPAGVYKKALLAPAADAPTPFFSAVSLPVQMRIQGTAMYYEAQDGNIYARPMSAGVTDGGTVLVTGYKGAGALNFHQDLVTTPTSLYWVVPPTSGTGGILRTVPIAGGTATEVTGALPRVWAKLAVSGEDVYFVQATNSAFDGLYHYKAGGTVELLVAKANLTGVTIEGDTLYFMESFSKLYKVPKTGGVGTLIAAGGGVTSAFAGFDATSLYSAAVWTTGSGFALYGIYKMPK